MVRPFDRPIYPRDSIAVLHGNLAPGGAIIKQSATNEKLMEHEGRAVVFEDAADLANRIDSPDLDVTAEDILVLKNIGPKGAPGMPEAGYIPIPMKLARRRSQRYRAHLGWTHEWYRLWDDCVARYSRVRYWGAIGAST